ncbi:MAG: asparagine synthase (glutamine-hydrolyzing) [Planctomycetaceae bacterium]|nr:asparagine synthase (glutamine-hydrolyzing) [Planctomycetaceae bacterium]
MCGIVGIWNRYGDRADPALVERMLATILHRGPDGGGVWSEGRIALGHRRLSILDLSAAGHQPMLTSDHRGVLAYNGEIYNYPEMRLQLQKEGVSFAGTSDTEVVLAALHTWGPERTIPLLNGMFAFAYLDLRCGALWLARDRLGIKPLYVAEAGQEFLFASEAKAILAHPGVVKQVDAAALNRGFLTRRRCHDTLFAGITGLPSGSWWKVTGDGIAKHRYFDLETALDRKHLTDNHRSIDLKHVIETLERDLRESVRMHLASDAPIAAMCSGGVDSSLVAAYAGDDRPGMIGYVAEAPVGSGEAAQARRVGRHINIPIREVAVPREDYLRLWPVCVWSLDSPAHHPSEPALLSVARTCRADGIKVLLTGEGADELFGGYAWHAAAHQYWRRWDWLSLVVPSLLATRTFSRRCGFPLQWPVASGKQYRSRARMALAADVERELLPRRLFASLPGIERLSDRALVVSGLTDLVEHLSWVLHRHDHMSMAASIEMRVPFLENHLINFGMHLPCSVKLRRGEGKWALKTVALKRLPRDVVFARKKGFPMPSAYTEGTERILLGGLLPDHLQWSRATTGFIIDDLRHDVDLRFIMVGMEIWLRQHFGNEASDAIGEKLLALAR